VALPDSWEVDLQTPDKVLTVSADNVNISEIKMTIEKVDYHAEELA
jgi:copper chaperone